MIDAQPVWTAIVAGLLLLMVGIFRRVPKCPRCGSFRTVRERWMLPRVRMCAACHELYEILD